MSDKIDTLKKLHTRLVDSRDGYRKAGEEVEDGASAAFVRERIAEREEFHRVVHDKLAAEGVEVDDDGSMMAAAHRLVFDLRGAISSDSSGIYAECVRGDEALKSTYDDAIEAVGNDPSWSVLTEQRSKVEQAIATAKARR